MAKPTIPAKQFAQEYAANSFMSVEHLHDIGFVVAPCDCDADGCRGWQMMSKETAALDIELKIGNFTADDVILLKDLV